MVRTITDWNLAVILGAWFQHDDTIHALQLFWWLYFSLLEYHWLRWGKGSQIYFSGHLNNSTWGVNAILSLYFHNYFLLFLRLNKIDKCFYLANISITECLFKQPVNKIDITTFFCVMSMALNPTIGWGIWSVMIKNGTSTWQFTPSSATFNCITVNLLTGISAWFPVYTYSEWGSFRIWLICFISASGCFCCI